MEDWQQLIKECDKRDLQKALNSNKEYIYFEFSIFNVGVMTKVICSNNYKDIYKENWNGYDLMLINDDDFKELLEQIILEKKEITQLN